VEDREYAELTVVVVSFNTRSLTLAALDTLFKTTKATNIRVVVIDNDSQDGSADAIAEHFPEVDLVRSKENLGFAKANNFAISAATSEWILLLNPDTECHEGSIDNLMGFAREHPEAGIWGGRTVFPDGTLNIASCWNRMTMWSLFCRSFGLSSIFNSIEFFNPEAIGGWSRNSVREVDIVVGCFLLVRRELWNTLGGFNLKYFMYGEEADLCLRAAKLGYRPMITPRAQIMHLVGAASKTTSRKKLLVYQARITLIHDHWRKWQVPFGVFMMWAGAGIRAVAEAALNSKSKTHRSIWAQRKKWLSGY